MTNDTPKSSKSKGKQIKQPDLRQFIFKRKRSSEGNSCSSPAPPNENVSNESNDSPSFPSTSVPQSQENDMEMGGSNNNNVPLEEEEEWLYDVELLPHDPGKRINIMDYPPKQRNAARRAYILKKPCQPKIHDFPQRECGGLRRFSVNWFKKWDWLEYSVEKDAAFCFVCFLFKNDIEICAGGDAFVNEGFRSWNKPDRFEKHVGGIKSAHNLAYEKYVNLKDAKEKSIYVAMENASDVVRSEYELRLKASLTCLRFLLLQGLAFRGHDEKTTKCIIEELGDDYFGILADESSDVSQKEQLALVLRYVDRKFGRVMERFLGIIHVGDTTALSLKDAIMTLLMDHSLSPSMIRGQGYDGASNMKGEINGLKTLIMNDTPRAYYLEVSCKRREMIRESQAQKVAQALDLGELESGSGLNQELGLKRLRDTRWGSHYKSLLNIIHLFPTIVEVLVHIGKHGSSEDKFKAQIVLGSLETFDFVFMAHLMLAIFGYTNDLCVALQRKEQDIVNAMELVSYTKIVLQKMREQGWEALLNKITSFCVKHGIVVPTMDASYVPQGRSRRFVEQTTNLQHFRVDIFLGVIDLHLQELDNRFNERNMELLTCMACLSPKDNFSSFDKDKVLKLVTFYPEEFSSLDVMSLELQLDIFIENMRSDNRFRDLNDLNSLSMKLVETNRHKTYPLIFLLIKLMLILPVATASVERVFSKMTYVKSKLRNSMGDQLMNDCLVTFIEKDVFLQVPDKDIIDRFQNMKARRMQL
ncbi:uncharacterized protein LOC104890039 [Beta vulgaris subsp. vulgaris]|uniref:uncharacterized protein LOC104890039 n=1 Tax=Beta vulgaris subsp. vulgaris TaxID=3555 RepID=UPI0025483E73|nr:uncharacterized protein LOC104890039 [Beta vulgaris subsp. vulgaris]